MPRPIAGRSCYDSPVLYDFAWKTIVRLARRRIRSVVGLESVPETGSYILASNHIGWLDPLYLAAALGRTRGYRIHFVSQTRKHLWAHTIPIDPENRRGVVSSATAVLERGGGVGIFPEGFSNSEPVMPRGKTGAARLALATGAPIVPVGIRGRAQPHWWRSVLWLLFPVNMVRAALQHRLYDVVFGEPIQVHRNPGTEVHTIHALTDRVMDEIAKLSGKRYAPNP